MTPEIYQILDALGNLALIILVVIIAPMSYYTLRHSIMIEEEKEKLTRLTSRVDIHSSDIHDLKGRNSLDLVSFLTEMLELYEFKKRE